MQFVQQKSQKEHQLIANALFDYYGSPFTVFKNV